MNSALQQILYTERERYFNFFVQTIDSLKNAELHWATELLVQPTNDNLIEPFNLVRLDFISKSESGEHSIKDIRLDKNLDYNKLEFTIEDLKVTLNPFCWNSCEFTVDRIEMDKLKQWVAKWLKIDQEVDNKPSNAIHSCSLPQTNGNMTTFTIDFGTTSPNTFADFLNLIAHSGGTTVSIETTEV
jgi:hypothetical protein